MITILFALFGLIAARMKSIIITDNLFLDDDSSLYLRIEIEHNDQILMSLDPG